MKGLVRGARTVEIFTSRSGRVVCIIGSIGFLLGSLGCTMQRAETQSPSTALPVTVEAVETVPIQSKRNGDTSLSTGEYCRRQGTRLQCTEVDLEELRDLFDELQPLDRY